MTSYRVAEEPDDPYAVDEAFCAEQRRAVQMAGHLAISLVTVGLWFPGFLVWFALSGPWQRAFADGYRVRVREGVLSAGNAKGARSVPLDAISDATIKDGRVSVTVNGGQPLVLYGLRDPQAAIEGILRARQDHLRALRGGGAAPRVRVADAPPEVVEVEAASDEAREAGR